MKWINYKERKPQIGVPVLGAKMGSTEQPYYCAALSRNKIIDLLSGTEIKITHWMKIPKPPEAEE